MGNLKKLKQALNFQEKITILGHDNIDVDAFISGILLSHFLDFLDIKNEFLILEEVKENETYHVIKEMFGIDMKDYYSSEENENRVLFLEDHYKSSHKGVVKFCLDHHPTNDKIVKNYLFYSSKISCSTSYMIYELMKEAGYEITEDEAKMILVSMMIDTVSFRSQKTVKEEELKAKELAKQYSLDYESLERYCLLLTPIEGVSINSIINNGYKYYTYGKNRVKSSYIQVYDMIDEETLINWILTIKEELISEGLTMWVFIIYECKNFVTYEYRITEKNVRIVKNNKILSRGTNIMPEIEKLFSN